MDTCTPNQGGCECSQALKAGTGALHDLSVSAQKGSQTQTSKWPLRGREVGLRV
jgi:hypothetical protein